MHLWLGKSAIEGFGWLITFHRKPWDIITYPCPDLSSGCGVVCHISESVLLQANAIHANRGSGVAVRQAMPVLLQRNSVTCNAGHGVEVTPQARVSTGFMVQVTFSSRYTSFESKCWNEQQSVSYCKKIRDNNTLRFDQNTIILIKKDAGVVWKLSCYKFRSECVKLLAPVRLEKEFKLGIFKLISVFYGWGISFAFSWMSVDLTVDKSTLAIEVMAWCCQATSH